jgi:hypothetical protein
MVPTLPFHLAMSGHPARGFGDRLAVLALNVESPEQDVRRVVAELGPDINWAIATPDAARAFGDVVSVPTLLDFDPASTTVGIW